MAISTHESNQSTLSIYLVSLKYIDLVMPGVWDDSAHPHPFQSMVVSSLIYSTQVSTSTTCAFISNTYASTSTTDASIYNFCGISCSSISLLCYGLNLCTWSSYCTPKRYTVYSKSFSLFGYFELSSSTSFSFCLFFFLVICIYS